MCTCGLGGTGDLWTASTGAHPGEILRFLLEEVKKKDCYKDLLAVPFFARQQIISHSNSREGECAGSDSTLYLEGYADGQQYHYAVWAARAL